jgi:SAM-dependent methyltransferase
MSWDNDKYKEIQTEFYRKRVEDFGFSRQADGWTSEKMSSMYYGLADKVFLDEIKNENKDEHFTLLDVGSGNGFYYRHLRDKGYLNSMSYTGLEITELAAKQAKENNSEANFIHGDLMSAETLNEKLAEKYDFVTAIGTFAVVEGLTDDERTNYAKSFVRRLFNLAKKGVAIVLHDDAIEPNNSYARMFELMNANKWYFTATNAFFSNFSVFYLYNKTYILNQYN